jgi:hypothetical protein
MIDVHGKGCQGTIVASGEGTVQLKIIGSSSWINPDRSFWKSQKVKDAAVMSRLAGKWIKVSSSAARGAFTRFCNLSSLMGKPMNEAKGLAEMGKGETATVNGRPALALKDAHDQGAIYVSVSSSPEVLRLVSPEAGASLDFSDYDAAVTLARPSAASSIDGSKYGM